MARLLPARGGFLYRPGHRPTGLPRRRIVPANPLGIGIPARKRRGIHFHGRQTVPNRRTANQHRPARTVFRHQAVRLRFRTASGALRTCPGQSDGAVPRLALLCGRRRPVFHRRDRRAQSRLLTFTANIPASCAKAKKPMTALTPQAFREPLTNSARKPVRTA